MTKTITFLHTSRVHIVTFDRLLAQIAPGIPARHIVDEALLHEARAAGGITPSLAQRITTTVLAAIEQDAAVVVCTCSTIGGCVEQMAADMRRPVLRIDRAMAEQAVMTGARIVLAAAVESTLEPTRQLLLDAADRAGRSVQITDVLCATAWAAFEAGDQEGYIEQIAATLQQAAHLGDVIVLAQASMAEAATRCADLGVPILSSPRLGLEAAVAAYVTA